MMHTFSTQLSQPGLHIILGPMYSGKSQRLMTYIRNFKLLSYPIVVLKPNNDVRYVETNHICTHDMDTEPCIPIPLHGLSDFSKTPEFLHAKAILIDEGQFFSGLTRFVVEDCFPNHKKVFIAALSGDSNRNPFGEINMLISLCSKIEWMEALCMRCKNGTPACYSKRISEETDQIVVGSTNHYEAVCFLHYE